MVLYYLHMRTPQAQIKINLPLRFKEFVESKASQFGMPLAAYMQYPTYEASEKVIKETKKALREKNRAIEVKDVHKFFKDL
ncbi:MAG: hypothetical protein UT63_C0025G0004 [Candidatus Gottesmanbacteria bacterium GW2011_GWC2_39_8]|uniref:Uncharacterized protein n=1 Tax=Candidatus Gottesmanbacteria bacterium GW2011_GWC2_39_8 TaxID=1618450 RepID=A0A0G0T598_9BACT|nr:MAG: hypothetical protein UT63_C0025G0004 [Candidatus Gottesmanbacteria bacterium GW2011_GWC2_39_8]